MAAEHNQSVTIFRTGLLIIRAWVEPGSSSPLRAQIRLTTDVSGDFERSMTVSEQDAVVAEVRAWLSEMLAGPDGAWNDSDNP
jgi:hypothetical protein